MLHQTSNIGEGKVAEGRPLGRAAISSRSIRHLVGRLAAMRGRAESYSDVILRLAKG